MDKFIIHPKALIKNILITDDYIQITDENHKTKETFLEKINHGKKGILDTIHQIEYALVTKIIPDSENNALQICFSENNKNQKIYLQLNTKEEFDEVLNFTLNKTNLQKNQVKTKSFESYKTQLIVTGMSILLSSIVYMDALKLEKGEVVKITGGRRGVKRLILLAAENLGTTNTIIFGTIITTALAIWTIIA